MKGGLYLSAMQLANWCRAALVAIASGLGWYFGRANGLFYALLVFCVLDWIIGIVRHALDKDLTSKYCAREALEKVLVFLLVGIGHIIDRFVIGSGQTVRTAVIFFYMGSEAISILEHAGHMGLPIPKKLRTILKELEDVEEESVLPNTQKTGDETTKQKGE